MARLTTDELKKLRRWVLWRLEEAKDKPGQLTKVPYQLNGYKASSTNPDTWSTYADVAARVAQGYTGVGIMMGELEPGLWLWSADLDKCCDAVTGKFSPESREIVIELDSYGEYSPSGTGCHILGLSTAPLPGKGVKRPLPGCKAVEVYDHARFMTFTGRHLSKTPADLVQRTDAALALYARVSKAAKPSGNGLTIHIPTSEEERLAELMAGDMSAHNDDHSTADYALCVLLAKKHGGNAFKVDAEFRRSGLYREKWEREDYRETTITRACAAAIKDAPVIFSRPEEEPMEDDGESEFLVDSGAGADKDGWFPLGELSVIGGPSGAGKTSVAMPMLEHIRLGDGVWGHAVPKPRDYRVLLHDRSKRAMNRTARALHLNDEARERIVRLSTEQQKRQPAEILEAAITEAPGVQVWFIEGLDLWIPDMNKMNVVGPIVDSIQRVATRRNVAVIASVGAPKQKGKDRYFGRDALFGSAALARKVETVMLMGLCDEEDPNSVRRCWILPRTVKSECLYFKWGEHGLERTEKAEGEDEGSSGGKKGAEQLANYARITAAVQSTFAPDEPVVHRDAFGPSSTYHRWREWALGRQILVVSKGKTYLAPSGCKLGSDVGVGETNSHSHSQM